MRNLKRYSLRKKKNPFSRLKAKLAAGFMAALTTAALANPSGPDVRAGNVNIQGLGTSNVNIQQLTQQAIINWNSFSIGSQEAVRFLQPNQMAVILNRVTGGDPSQILGQLGANGNVFLINPAGITVGNGARIDVGGLVLSTLGISDEDFLNGNYTFEQDPAQELASIVNQGTITISDGGYAVLTAPLVSNEGLIVANLGKVVLAGGEKTTLNFDGRNLINYELGAITGDAGTVVLPRESVSAVLTDMLGVTDRAKGLIQRDDGSFALEGASGTVYQAGTVRADGAEGQDAGTVIIDSARLTYLGGDSVTAADGVGQNSDGGTVIAFSNLGRDGDQGGITASMTGSLLSAQGGESGDGGFIEFSGAQFALGSTLDTRAENGLAGTVLLDPRDIIIVDGPNTGTPFPLPAAPTDSTINDGQLEALAGTTSLITLQADRDIRFEIDDADNVLDLTALVDPGVDAEDHGHLVLDAGRDVLLGNDVIQAPAIDILAGGDVLSQDITGAITGGRVEAFDIDIGVRATDPLAVGTSGSPVVAGRTVEFVGGEVDINFARLGAEPTFSSNPAVANPQRQDLSVLAVGDITLTDVTTVPVRSHVNTADQISAERFIREANNISTTSTSAPGIWSRDGDITIDFNDPGNPTTGGRFFTAGKGVNTADGSGDTGRNSVLATGEGQTVSIRAGGLVDRAGGVGLSDIASNRGNIVLTATNGPIGALGPDPLNADAGDPFDISGQAITATVLREGSLLALDVVNEDNDFTGSSFPVPTVIGGIDFLNIEVNDGDAFIRNDRPGALGNLSPSLIFDPATTAIQTAGSAAFDVVDARFANNGNVGLGDPGDASQVVSVATGTELVIEAIADGTDLGTILDLNGANNNVVLSDNSSIGFVADGTIGTLADTIEVSSTTTDANAPTLGANSDNGGIFFDVSGDIVLADMELVNTVTNGTVQVVSGLIANNATDGDIKVTATDMFIRNDITAGDELELVATDDIVILDDITNTADTVDDQEANLTAGTNAVVRAGDNITQQQGGVITAVSLGLAGDDIGTSTNSIDTDVTNLTIDADTSAYVQDTDNVNGAGVLIVNQVQALMAMNAVTGNDAGTDYRVQANGNIEVDDAITGADVSLVTTNGGIQLDTGIGDGGTNNVVLSATGDITQNGGTVLSTNVGLDGNNIGLSTNSFDTTATNLTIDAEGNAYVQDADGVNIINQVNSTAANDQVNGNDAGGDYRVQAAGSINLNLGNITGQDITLLTTVGNIFSLGDIGDGGTQNIVLSAPGNVGNLVGTSLRATNVGLDANNVGSSSNPVAINATNVTIDAENNAYVRDSNGGLNIIDQITSTSVDPGTGGAGTGDRVTGNEATGDYRVQAAGNIRVDDDVNATDVSLVATGAGSDITVNENILGMANTVLIAGGDIADNNVATVSGDNVGLAGNNIGSVANNLNVGATNLAIDAANNAYVQDSGGVEIIDEVMSTSANDTVTGNEAGGDYRVQSSGNILVSDPISGVDITLETVGAGNITVDENVGVGGTTNNVVLSAVGNITDSGTASVTGTNIGLEATNIGTSGNNLNTAATNLVIDAGNDAFVQDADAVNIINQVQSTAANDIVTGNDAGNDYRVEAAGNIQVNDAVTGSEISLIATGGTSDVNLNDDVGSGAATNVVIEAGDDITQLEGEFIIGTDIGLEAGGDIGTPNLNDDVNAVDITATNLALDAGASANVRDTAGGLTLVNSVTSTAAGDNVTRTGDTAGTSLELEANGTNAELTIDDAIQVGTDADLVADGDVTINQSITTAAGGDDNVVIVADNDGDNDGDITQSAGTITADGLGVSAVAVGPLTTAVSTFVADSVDPNPITIVDTVGDLTLDGVTAVDETVGNLRSAGDIKVQALGGSLFLNVNVEAGGNVELDAVENIVLDANVTSTAVDGIVVLVADYDGLNANTGLPVVSALAGDGTGSITQVNGNVITGTSVGLRAAEEIGAADNSIDIVATNLAIEGGTGSAFVMDTGGVTIVDEIVGLCATITGNTSGADYRVESTGTITVEDTITATDISLVSSGGGINVNDNVTATDDAVLSAAGNIVDDNTGVVSAANIGLDGDNIGTSTNSLNIDANNLTIDAEDDAYVVDSDEVTIVAAVNATSVDTGVGGAIGDLVTGNDALNDYRVEAGGNIVVDNAITGGDITLQTTAGDITVNQNVGDAGTVDGVLSATGDITGNALITADNLGLSGGNVGTSAATPLNIEADNLAINATSNAYVSDSNDINLVNQVSSTAANDTVTGNTAGDEMRVVSGGNINVQDDVTVSNLGARLDLVATNNVNFDAVNVTVGTDPNNALDDGITVIRAANGNITQTEGGLISSRVLGLSSGNDIGTPGGGTDVNALDVSTSFIQINAGGDANILDAAGNLDTTGAVSDLLFVQTNPIDNTSSQTGGSLELETTGQLFHASGVLTVGTDADLVGGTSVIIGLDVNVGDNLVVSAGTGSVLSLAATTPTLTADAIGFSAPGSISQTGGNPLRVNTDQISYDSMSEVDILDLTGDLEIVASVTAVDETVNNATSGNNSSVEAGGGNLTVSTDVVNNNVGATGLDLIALGNVVLDGNVTNSNGNVVVRADSDNDGAGAISQTQGDSIVAAGIGLSAGDGGIGVAGGGDDDNAVDINATNLTVETSGSANVLDSAGGVTLVNSVTAFRETVTGNVIGGSLELEADGGDGADLTINSDLMVGTSADLVSDDDVIFDNTNVTAANNVVIVADDDGNNTGGVSQLNGGSFASDGLGIRAGQDATITVDVNNLALDVNGTATITDGDGFTVAASVTAVDETVNNMVAANLKLDGGAGSITINTDATVTGNIDVFAAVDVILNATLTAGGNIVVVADTDANGTGSITQMQGETLNAVGVGLSAGEDIGTATNAIDINATNLAIGSGTEIGVGPAGGPAVNAYVNDLTGDLTIVDQVAAECFVVTGNTTTGDYNVQSVGLLTVDDAITGGDVTLVSSGDGITVNQTIDSGTDIKLDADTDVTVNAALNAGGDIDVIADQNVALNADVISSGVGSNIVVVADADGAGGVGAITQADAAVITGANVGLSAEGDIGGVAAANRIEVNADELAIETAAGSAYVSDLSGTLEIVDQVVGQCFTVMGNTAAADYRVDAVGDITVNDAISATDIALVTTGGGITVNQQVGVAGTTDDAVLSATGDLVDGAAGEAVVAANIGLDGANIGAAGTNFDIDADNLAVDSTASAFVNDTDDVTLVDQVVSTAATDTVTGNTATTDYRVEAAGNIDVNDGVSAQNISLVTTAGDINVNQQVGVAGTTNNAVLSATGDLVDGLGAGAEAVVAGSIGLDGANIGTAGTNFDIDADNLAVDSTVSAFVNDTDDVTLVNQVQSTAANDTVTGNTATTDYRVQAAGNIDVNDAVSAGNISLVTTAGDINVDEQVGVAGTTNNAVLQASGNIVDASNDALEEVVATDIGLDGANIGSDTNNFDVDADTLVVNSSASAFVADTDEVTLVDQVASTSAIDTVTGNTATNDFRVQTAGNLEVNAPTNGVTGNDISLVSTAGDVTQTDGDVVATGDLVVSAVAGDITQAAGNLQGANIGLEAVNIGANGNEIDIDADNLAIDAGTNAFVTDVDNVALVDSVTSTAANDTVTGNDAGNDLRIVAAGNLDVNAGTNGVTGNDIDLVSTGGDVNQQAGNISAANNVVVSANGTITQTQGTLITGTDVGLEAAGGDIGTPGADVDAIDIDATNLAIEAGGNVNILDADNGVTLIETVTAVVETVGTGGGTTTIGGSLELEADGGDGSTLTIDDDLNIGAGADLVADDDVVINENVTAANNLVVRADDDNNDDGVIAATGTLTADGLGLSSAGNIDDGGGGALMVDVNTFAVDAGGSASVEDANGTFTIDSVTGVDETVNGATAGTDLKLVASGTDLILNANATAGGNIDIVANQNVTLNADVVSTGANSIVVVAADADGVGGVGAITQTDGEVITGTTVGLSAETGIGTVGAGDIDINADQLAAETTTGSVFVDDLSGTLEIIDEVVGQCFTVVGNTAGTDYRVQTVGDLTINTPVNNISASDISLVSTGGGVAQTAGNVVATDDLVVSAGGGDITQVAGTLQAANIGLEGTNIGTATDNIDIDADNLSIDAGNDAFVADSDDVTLVDNVTATAAADSVTGNDAGNDLRVQAAGNLTVNDPTGVTGTDISLVSTNGDVTQTAGNVVATNDLVVSAVNGDITQAGGALQAANIGLAANNIGTATANINIDADNLAIDAGNDAFVSDSDDVTLVDSVIATAANDTVTGNDAGNDFRVQAAGNLTVNDPSGVTGTDISLVSTNGDVNQTAGNVVATNDLVVSAVNGDITQAGGTLQAANIGLEANNIGTATDNIDIDADNLAIDAGNDAFVSDSDDVTLVDSVTATAANDTVTGNEAGNDFRVQAAGNLTVNDPTGVTGTDISLVSTNGDVNQTAGNVVATNDLVVSAVNGDITQAGGALQAANIGLEANNIGTATDNIDIDADNLAIDAGNDAFVSDSDDVTLVDSVTATAANDTVTGNEAGNDFRVQSAGNLDVNAPVNGVMGSDVSLVSTGGDVNQTAGTITGAGNIVLDANGSITQSDGSTLDAPNVGLSATNGDIGTPGDATNVGNPIDINADNLAVNAPAGSANVLDQSGDLTLVDQVTSTAANDQVTGTTLGGSLQLNAEGGNLTIDDPVTVGTDIDLVAGNDVLINQNLTSNDPVDGNIVIVADNNNNGNGAITPAGGVTITAAGLGLDAAEDIGVAEDDGNVPLVIDVDNLAVNSDADVNIIDTDDGVTIVTEVIGVFERVGGATAGGSLEIEAQDNNGGNDGFITVDGPVSAGTELDLVAEDDINLNNNVTAGTNAVVIADSDNDGDGAITQTAGNITATSLGLSTGENAGSAADPIDVNVDNLAVDAGGADLFVNDLAGGVTIVDEVEAVEDGFGVPDRVTGNNAQNLSVTATGGNLTVDAPTNGVTTTEDLDLVADNDVELTNGTITSVNAVIRAGQDITQTNGAINTTSLGLNAGRNVAEAADPLDVMTDNLAVEAGNDAFITDPDGVTVVNNVTAVVEQVNGNTTGGDLALTTEDGNLIVAGNITTGEDLELVARDGDNSGDDANIDLGNAGNLVAIDVGGQDRDLGADGDRDNAIFSSDGNITQGPGSTLSVDHALGLETVDGDIGSQADPLEFDAVQITVDAQDDGIGGVGAGDNDGGNAHLNDLTGGVEIVGQVNAINEVVTGNQTDGDLNIISEDGNIEVNADITTGEDLELVARDGDNSDDDGQINLNNAIINVGGQDRDPGFDGDLDNAVLSAAGDITQGPNGQLNVDRGLGLETEDGDVGTPGQPLNIDAIDLAIDVNDPNIDGDGGSAFINDIAGGVNLVDEVTSINITVSQGDPGMQVANDLAVTTQDGDLNVNTDVTTGEDLELIARDGDQSGDDGNVNLGQPGTPVDVIVGGQDRDLGFDGDRDNAIIIADGNVTQEDGGSLQIDHGLGIQTTDGDVGSQANPVEFDAVELVVDVQDDGIGGVGAGDNDGGNAHLNDVADGVNIVDEVNAINEMVVGNNTDGDLNVISDDGNLDVTGNVTTGEDLELVARDGDGSGDDGDINLNDAIITVGGQDRDLGFDGDRDNAVLSSARDITQGPNGQLNIDHGLGVETGDGDVGTQAQPLQIDAVELAVDANDPSNDGDGGNAYLNDTDGGIDLVDEVTSINITVSQGEPGLQTDNDLGVTTENGDLDVLTDVTTGEDLELFAGGGNLNLGEPGTPVDIIVGGQDRDPGFDGDRDNAVIGADGDITQEDGGSLQIDDSLGIITTDGDVGEQNDPLDFDAVNLTVDVNDPDGNGDGGNAYVNDTAGGINLIDEVTAINIPVSQEPGIQVDNDLAVMSAEGDINVNTDVTTGEDLELFAKDTDNSGDDGDINFGEPGNPVTVVVGGDDRDDGFDGDKDNAVIIAQGDITQEEGGQILVDNALGIQADGTIGTPDNPIDVNVNALVIGSIPQFINDPDGFVRLPEIQAINETVTNIVVDPLPVNDALPLIILPQNNINLVEDVLLEALADNDDRIINQHVWDYFGDDQLGLRKRK